MNKIYNILTICSALIFLFLIIFPENNNNNYIFYILIFTSILYKYLHFYNYGSVVYIIARKIDQIIIGLVLLSYFNHFYKIYLKNIYLFIISTIINYNFKIFKYSLLFLILKILYFSFKKDKFITLVLLISIIISLFSYSKRLQINTWTIDVSWCWHLSCCCLLTCLQILSSNIFI